MRYLLFSDKLFLSAGPEAQMKFGSGSQILLC